MKEFLNDNFILDTKTSEILYHDHAKKMPIIDFHCHLSPADIANDRQFENLTKVWLEGDHYKWRAMRTNGVDEKYCTGSASDYEKFEKWAWTVPYTMRNPLYHWTHLELKSYFDCNELLNTNTAKKIYNECSEKLNTAAYSVRSLLQMMKVEVVCTTDDPIDTLEFHKKIKKDGYAVNVLPTFRPDKILTIDNYRNFNDYLNKLEIASTIPIKSYTDVLAALKARHSYFHEHGCRLADSGLEIPYALDYTEKEIREIFNKGIKNECLTKIEILKYRSAILHELAIMNHERGWTQQLHLGALRNNSSRMMSSLGPDTGFDSIGDFEIATSLSRFMDNLDTKNKLAKTILYNLNPRDNEMMATMAGNFNDGSFPGKIQYGAAWWFLDQKDGMEKQINSISNLGLLSRFVGMLTDSRSFLSYPRHEYFRRILCNLIGNDVENGLLPNDLKWLGQMVENICYFNAKNYLDFNI